MGLLMLTPRELEVIPYLVRNIYKSTFQQNKLCMNICFLEEVRVILPQGVCVDKPTN